MQPEAFSDSFSLEYLLHNILLIQAWDFLPEATWNKPAWSISTEMFAYMIFAFICLFFKHSTHFLFLGISILLITVGFFYFDVMTATYSGALVRCLVGFSTGVVVHWMYTHLNKIQIPLASLVELAVICATFLGVIHLKENNSILIIPMFSLAILVFAFEQGKISSILRRTLFTFAGERSYSIYLKHSFCAIFILSIASLSGHLGRLPDGNTGILLPSMLADLVIIIFIVITIIVSTWTHRFIEIPGQRLGRLLTKKKFNGN